METEQDIVDYIIEQWDPARPRPTLKVSDASFERVNLCRFFMPVIEEVFRSAWLVRKRYTVYVFMSTMDTTLPERIIDILTSVGDDYHGADDFETYDDGDIEGQVGPIGPAWVVTLEAAGAGTATVDDDALRIKNRGDAGTTGVSATVEPTAATTLANGDIVRLVLQSIDTSDDKSCSIGDGAATPLLVLTCTDDTITYLDNATPRVIATGLTQGDTWSVDVRRESATTVKLRYRVNLGDWSAWSAAYSTAGGESLDTNDFTLFRAWTGTGATGSEFRVLSLRWFKPGDTLPFPPGTMFEKRFIQVYSNHHEYQIITRYELNEEI
jgi:hypothetical protein